MFTLLLATLFAARLGGFCYAIGVGALMAFAPTQLHMSQHALVDGFFSFWATLVLWLFWENLQCTQTTTSLPHSSPKPTPGPSLPRVRVCLPAGEKGEGSRQSTGEAEIKR